MAKAGNGANFPVGQPGRPRPGSALRGEEEQQVENLVSLPIPLPGPGDKVVSVDVEPGAPVNRNDQLRGGSRVEIKAELLALKELEGSASTVQWKGFCVSCGARGSTEHYDVHNKCKKLLSWEKKGFKANCKYCNENTHWVDGCPYLASFCFRCWCWGHMDACHAKFDDEFINSLKESYSQHRLMFHSATKEHIPPANLKKGDGWIYQGTRADLVSYAENIQPEGTFQPWLNINWG
ncbi:uncharacterized protein LOC111715644 [Eurytemora carolleeae]|uniref:uncharacterized protein LOC111715644 n=1 Tax=Eurytemora carolleeae TaxID=1294199 RepID=UPI000C78B369|nr:uncharacterized protein LOC111715644 [Eurytemora carolleeae]|eukprot:XP_023346760.1 uncharacterized protein LOC111715644 [Eurytemora affinis]